MTDIREYPPSIETADLEIVSAILLPLKPKIIVEIGTFYGGSARYWIKSFTPDLFISIEQVDKPQFVKLEEGENYHYLYNSNSNSGEVVQKVIDILGGKKIDYLFIDGGHSFPVVTEDFRLYSQMVKESGIIGFHDIFSLHESCQVRTLWEELKKRYDFVEINCGLHSTGFGLIYYRSVPYIFKKYLL